MKLVRPNLQVVFSASELPDHLESILEYSGGRGLYSGSVIIPLSEFIKYKGTKSWKSELWDLIPDEYKWLIEQGSMDVAVCIDEDEL